RAPDAGNVMTLSDSACRPRAAGTRLVFVRNADPTANGGITTFEATFDHFSLSSSGSLYVGHGGAALDSVSWTSSAAGTSTSLNPDQIDAVANDDESNWCAGQGVYGAGGQGTPGQANSACLPPIPAGMCVDGDQMRSIVSPLPGDLVISEFMPSPEGAGVEGEWFEVTLLADVDVNGLEFGPDAGNVMTLSDSACRPRAAGSRLVFVRSADPTANGGITTFEATFDHFSLPAGSGSIYVG